MPTMAKRDYYEVLGVARSVSHTEIASAYRKLAIQYHPDKNPGDEDAVARFKEAAEAFEVLGDAEKRSRYDRFGHAGVSGPGGGGSHFRDINDIFAAFGDIFGEGFGDIFGGRRRRPTKGADVRCDVRLDLIEAARGVTRTIEFERHEICTECEGSGAKKGTRAETCSYCGGRGQVVQSTGIFRVQTTCPSCRGTGTVIKQPCSGCRGQRFVVQRVKREVHIPAGIDDQMRVRLAGEGEPSPTGGPRGDCYCFISIKEHALFQREGQHLIVRIPITYPQAALGAPKSSRFRRARNPAICSSCAGVACRIHATGR
jgi:molecular chaperone DnaJ